MAYYDRLFDALGLRAWCDAGESGGPMTMAQLLARSSGSENDPAPVPLLRTPFPSLDELNAACPAVTRTRDMTDGMENAFLAVKDPLKIVLDPITQPLSWALNGSLDMFQAIPWFVLIPLLGLLVWVASRSWGLVGIVAGSFLFLAFIDHYSYAVQTLSIIFVCTLICVALGVPIGIAMSRSDAMQRATIPILDMLQTLPTFVYLIPLIFLFSVTEPKLYGIAQEERAPEEGAGPQGHAQTERTTQEEGRAPASASAAPASDAAAAARARCARRGVDSALRRPAAQSEEGGALQKPSLPLAKWTLPAVTDFP